MTPKQKRNLIAWAEHWHKKCGTDRKRSETRAKAARRLIDLWESAKKYKKWAPINSLAPENNSYRRWVRRNMYTLEAAGLVETMRPSKTSEVFFRVKQ